MVVISRPSMSAASERHAFTRLPSISTVQAPHWPRPQPFFEPVRCRCSRRASSSVVRGSSASRCSVPLTRSSTSSGAGVAPAPCATASGLVSWQQVSSGQNAAGHRGELQQLASCHVGAGHRQAPRAGGAGSEREPGQVAPADLIDANSPLRRSCLSRASQRCAPIKRGLDHIVSGGDGLRTADRSGSCRKAWRRKAPAGRVRTRASGFHSGLLRPSAPRGRFAAAAGALDAEVGGRAAGD